MASRLGGVTSIVLMYTDNCKSVTKSNSVINSVLNLSQT